MNIAKIGRASSMCDTATTLPSILAEAHGIVTDMLVDSSSDKLPPNTVAALETLSRLLLPSKHYDQPSLTITSCDDAAISLSDDDQHPFIAGHSSPSINLAKTLRRMSTSGWSTTTSATGMPIIHPSLPNRHRHCKFVSKNIMSKSLETSEAVNLSTEMLSTQTPEQNFARQRSRSVSGINSSLNNTLFCKHSFVESSIMNTKINKKSDEESHVLLSENEESTLRPHKLACFTNSAAAEFRLSVVSEEPFSNHHPTECYHQQPVTTAPAVDSRESPCSLCVNTVCPSLVYCPVHRRLSEPCRSRCVHHVLLAGPPDNRRHSANLECVIGHQLQQQAAEHQTAVTVPLCTCRLVAKGCRILHSPTKCCSTRNTFGFSPICEECSEPNLYDTNMEEPTDDQTIIVKNKSSYRLDSLLADPLFEDIYKWNYPIFQLEASCNHQMLSKMCYRVFYESGLLETFRIPLQEFFNYFHMLELGYYDQPYHNRAHATDVLQTVFYLTSQSVSGLSKEHSDDYLKEFAPHIFEMASDTSIGLRLLPLELMALYTASAMHDYEHPGRTNAFLVATMSPLAVLYNDHSVLEMHHAASAWKLFLSNSENNFLCHLDDSEFKRFRYLVIETILATDLKRHFDILAEFSLRVNDTNSINWNSEQDRQLMMEMCIKMADINGPCKEFCLHYEWTQRIANEFYDQGDEERMLGMQVSPYMDRENEQLAKLQESFINHLVGPICNSLYEAGFMPSQCINIEQGDKKKTICVQKVHLSENLNYWLNKIKTNEILKNGTESKQLVDFAVKSEHKRSLEKINVFDSDKTSILDLDSLVSSKKRETFL